jgi:hypothetical protein
VFDHVTQKVTAVARNDHHVDLFTIGFDNVVWSCWWEDDGGGWRPWSQTHPERVFARPVTAVARNRQHVDLFTIGYDGAVWSTWSEQGRLWIHWDNPYIGANLYEQSVSSHHGLYFRGGTGNDAEPEYHLISPERRAAPGYLPSTHGFHFTNSWPDVHITSITLPDPFGDIPIGNASWGLCGGMSFASRDYFEARQLAPSRTDNPPGEGDELFDYIVRRLAQSLSLDDVADFVKYADPIYPDTDDPTLGDGRNWVMAHSSWPGIRDCIDAGLPCPIGLVIGYLPNLTELGHQVCVYAYELRGQQLTLWVYDPNSPGNDDVTLSLDLARTDQSLINVASKVNVGHSPICFFLQSYERRNPVQGRA